MIFCFFLVDEGRGGGALLCLFCDAEQYCYGECYTLESLVLMLLLLEVVVWTFAGWWLLSLLLLLLLLVFVG